MSMYKYKVQNSVGLAGNSVNADRLSLLIGCGLYLFTLDREGEPSEIQSPGRMTKSGLPVSAHSSEKN